MISNGIVDDSHQKPIHPYPNFTMLNSDSDDDSVQSTNDTYTPLQETSVVSTMPHGNTPYAPMISNGIVDNSHQKPQYKHNFTMLNGSSDDAFVQGTNDTYAPLQDNFVASTMHGNTVDATEPRGTPPFMAANDDIEIMMAQLRESIEIDLTETKQTVESLFHAISEFHHVAKSVHETWSPIYEAELQESLRLDELQQEVQGVIDAYPENVPTTGSSL